MQCVILKAENNELNEIELNLDFCGVIYKLKSRLWWDCLEILAQTSGSDMAAGAVAVPDVPANGSVDALKVQHKSQSCAPSLFFANMLLEPFPPP